MNCGIGHRHSSDPVWLWLWHQLSAAAPLRPLALELPYAVGEALKDQKKKKKKKKKKKNPTNQLKNEYLSHAHMLA